MRHGFTDSGIRLNGFFNKVDEWNLVALQARSTKLKKMALDIWAKPESRFKPYLSSSREMITLEDDISVTGRKLTAYIFQGQRYETSAWVEMYLKVIQILFNENPTPILQCINDEEQILNTYFKNEIINRPNHWAKIGEYVFVLKHSNTMNKLRVLQNLFNLYELPASSLMFILKENSDND